MPEIEITAAQKVTLDALAEEHPGMQIAMLRDSLEPVGPEDFQTVGVRVDGKPAYAVLADGELINLNPTEDPRKEAGGG